MSNKCNHLCSTRSWHITLPKGWEDFILLTTVARSSSPISGVCLVFPKQTHSTKTSDYLHKTRGGSPTRRKRKRSLYQRRLSRVHARGARYYALQKAPSMHMEYAIKTEWILYFLSASFILVMCVRLVESCPSQAWHSSTNRLNQNVYIPSVQYNRLTAGCISSPALSYNKTIVHSFPPKL